MQALSANRPKPVNTAALLGAMTGDDLGLSRQFVDCAQGHITLLQSDAELDVSDIQDALVEISDQAQRLHARAIDRAAQAAMSMSEGSDSFQTSTGWNGQIRVLDGLIQQYTSGLIEIETELQGDAPSVDNSLLALDNDLLTKDSLTEETHFDLEGLHREAKKTLKPLLRFAENENDREALTHLLALDLSVENPARKEVSFEFESLIPVFTNAALRTARQTDKVVSVSYVCEAIDMAVSKRLSVEALLQIAAEWIVNVAVDLPAIRQAREQSGAGHIAVTVTQSAKTIAIVLNVADSEPIEAMNFPKNEALDLLQGNAQTHFGSDGFTLELKLPLKGSIEDFPTKLTQVRA